MKTVNKNNLLELLNSGKKKEKVSFGDYEMYVAALTISEQLEIEALTKQSEGSTDLVRALIRFACVDEDDNKLFTDNILIDKMPAALASLVFETALKLNGLDKQDLKVRAKN